MQKEDYSMRYETHYMIFLSLSLYWLHMIKPDIFVVNAEKVVTETTDISIILLFTDN